MMDVSVTLCHKTRTEKREDGAVDLCNNVRCETITIAEGCPMSVFHVPPVCANANARAVGALERLREHVDAFLTALLQT